MYDGKNFVAECFEHASKIPPTFLILEARSKPQHDKLIP